MDFRKEFDDLRALLPIMKRDLSDEIRKSTLRPGQENALIEKVQLGKPFQIACIINLHRLGLAG